MKQTTRLWCEYVLIWLGLPAGVAALRVWVVEVPVVPLLWTATLLCFLLLWRDRSFDRKSLWNTGAVREHIRPVLIRFAVIAPVIFAAVWLLTPDRMLMFPRMRPGIWAAVMLLYPPLSVYPQGIIWRSFMLHRYGGLIRQTWLRCAMAALAFGWLHIVFVNWQAIVLTLVGGYLFTLTHQRSKSLLVSSIEHALYGCCVFTAGWGLYFYHGSRQFVEQMAGQ